MVDETRYFRLALQQGEAPAGDGRTVHWAACPDLPGAYEEGRDGATALGALRGLVVRIIAEHIVRGDPLDAAIISTTAPRADDPASLSVAIGAAELEEARTAPLLSIEQPEP